MSKGKRITQQLKCKFTTQDVEAKSQELASLMQQYDALESERRRTSEEYTKQLGAIRGNMRELSKRIKAREEERQVACVVSFNTPQPGIKTTSRLDTREIIAVEPMTDEDSKETQVDDIDVLEKLYALEVAQDELKQAEQGYGNEEQA